MLSYPRPTSVPALLTRTVSDHRGDMLYNAQVSHSQVSKPSRIYPKSAIPWIQSHCTPEDNRPATPTVARPGPQGAGVDIPLHRYHVRMTLSVFFGDNLEHLVVQQGSSPECGQLPDGIAGPEIWGHAFAHAT